MTTQINNPSNDGSGALPHKVPLVESCAFEHGCYPDSYLITEPDYEHFWDAERTGCIGYYRDGQYLHVVGGVIAPPDRQDEVLRQFTEFSDANRFLSTFFSISETDLPLFRKYGYQTTKFGEHTDLPLDNHSWSGKPHAWVRRQVSFVSRQGLVAREIPLHALLPAERTRVFSQLEEINREHLSARVFQHEIGLLEGRLLPEHFYRRRLFVASEADNPERWQAFVACTPLRGGRAWATELYRNCNQSVRGVIPFLIAALIDQFKAEGSESVSLCMVPAINCGEPLPGDSRLARLSLGFWEKRLAFIFNSRGLYHFKSRFRPVFSPAYLCVRPGVSLGSTWSFMKMAGLFQFRAFDWKRVLFSRKGGTRPSEES